MRALEGEVPGAVGAVPTRQLWIPAKAVGLNEQKSCSNSQSSVCLDFYCFHQSPSREVQKEGEGLELTVALDFSFSGCSLQLPTDPALSSAESHAKVSASTQHLTDP